MKKSVSFILVVLLVFSMFSISFGQGNGNKFLNDDGVMIKKNSIKIHDDIYSISGKINIPVRGFASSMGVEVGWDNDKRMVIMTKGGIVVTISIDDGVIRRNGEIVNLGIKPKIIKNRSYVPNKFFKILFDVEFDDEIGKELIGDSKGPLTEANLDNKYIELRLISESFVDGTLMEGYFELIDGPVGLEIERIDYISPTKAILHLEFDGTDFDEDYDEFMVAISKNELVGDDDLSTQYMEIKANDQQDLIGIPEGELSEYNLDGMTVRAILIDETFTDSAIAEENVILMNAPEGLSIGSIVYLSPTAIDVVLIFDGTDFDEDYDEFMIKILEVELAGDNDVISQKMEIAAESEEGIKALIVDPLNESELNGQFVILILLEDEFVDDSLDKSNFELLNEPEGLTIKTVAFSTSTHAIVHLDFDGTDFDVDIDDFRIKVDDEELVNAVALETDEIEIEAIVEEVHITPNAMLMEDTLSGSSIYLTLINDTFVDTTLAGINFVLNNPPAGLTISGIEYTSTTESTINLNFDGTDFDVHISDFSITVLGEELMSGSDITSGALTISAIEE